MELVNVCRLALCGHPCTCAGTNPTHPVRTYVRVREGGRARLFEVSDTPPRVTME